MIAMAVRHKQQIDFAQRVEVFVLRRRFRVVVHRVKRESPSLLAP
jgi:hypothetical protein